MRLSSATGSAAALPTAAGAAAEFAPPDRTAPVETPSQRTRGDRTEAEPSSLAEMVGQLEIHAEVDTVRLEDEALEEARRPPQPALPEPRSDQPLLVKRTTSPPYVPAAVPGIEAGPRDHV